MNFNEMSFAGLIERYGEAKTVVDSYNKQLEADNKEIKKRIVEVGVPVEGKPGSFTGYSENYKVTCSVSKSEDFDETKLIAKLKELIDKADIEHLSMIKKCIVYKPVVDMDALENAIYHGVIPASELNDCRISKEVSRLTVKKIEKKAEE